MALTSTPVAITAGSGTSIAGFSDGTSVYQRVIVAPEDTQLTTYSAMYKAVSAGTAATTNILTMAGSATKTVKITRLTFSGTIATTAVYFDILVNRQSAVDTGGTAATAATIVKYDTNNAAASAAAPIFYTAGPTAGTVTGTLSAVKYLAPVTGTPAAVAVAFLIDSTFRPAQAITLRGVTDVLAITLNAVTPGTASSLNIVVEWNES